MSKNTVTFFNLGALLAVIFGVNLNFQSLHSYNYYDSLIQRDVKRPVQAQVQNASSAQEELDIVRLSEQAIEPIVLDEDDYVSRFSDLDIALHPGSEFKPDSDGTDLSVNHCKSLVYRTLKSLPTEPVKKLKNLTLYFSDNGRRGLGGGDTIILRCQNVTDEELVGVLVHEMGHIMDTGVIQGSSKSTTSEFHDGSTPIYENDSSLEFYRLSFENEKELKDDVTDYDFVSGYAMSDPFEDFAETFAFYILHGNEFRELTKNDLILAKKYEFMKTVVFTGKEYFNGSDEQVDQAVRHYDVTVLPYSMNRFFKI